MKELRCGACGAQLSTRGLDHARGVITDGECDAIFAWHGFSARSRSVATLHRAAKPSHGAENPQPRPAMRQRQTQYSVSRKGGTPSQYSSPFSVQPVCKDASSSGAKRLCVYSKLHSDSATHSQ